MKSKLPPSKNVIDRSRDSNTLPPHQGRKASTSLYGKSESDHAADYAKWGKQRVKDTLKGDNSFAPMVKGMDSSAQRNKCKKAERAKGEAPKVPLPSPRPKDLGDPKYKHPKVYRY